MQKLKSNLYKYNIEIVRMNRILIIGKEIKK